MRVGVDVGGTHTDAVVIADGRLLAAHKTLTTSDIASGVLESVREVLRQAAVAPGAVRMMNLGTTQFTNAVVERRRLSPIGAIRIGAQSSSALPVAAKWPAELRDALFAGTGLDPDGLLIDGGTEYDGRPIVPLDEQAVDQAIEQLVRSAVPAVAITSVFATTDAQAELDAAARLRARAPKVRIALSHQLGHLGLYQRENATLLNAALLPLADEVVSAFEHAFAALSMRCPFFISQNDGTLMSASFARAYPVFTFSSGPTNSMRGALWLARQGDAMVVDVGGTTADIGMLVDGYPRPSGSAVRVGGVLTNFRMPDVLAVGLGGGSVVSEEGRQVGPASVGRDLCSQAVVFGGEVLTATDVSVALGKAAIGDPRRVKDLPQATLTAAADVMRERLEVHIDQMKTSAAALPLVVVGGGAFLVPQTLAGVSEIVRPDDGAVANAIGAALGQIGGEAQGVYVASRQPREQALAAVKAAAVERAVQAGAQQGTVEVVEVNEVPLSYSDEPGGTLHARAVGEADLLRVAQAEQRP